jgi:hypothetical protein
MADEGSTASETAAHDGSGVHRLRAIVAEEVSFVDRAANKRRFLLVKRSSRMANNGKPKGTRLAPDAGHETTLQAAPGSRHDSATRHARCIRG